MLSPTVPVPGLGLEHGTWVAGGCIPILKHTEGKNFLKTHSQNSYYVMSGAFYWVNKLLKPANTQRENH